MKNVTLAIDHELLRKARALAAERGSTLNAMIRVLLAREVGQAERIARAKAGMRELMDKAPLHLGPDFRFDRRNIHDPS
jgi:hypothetical protein